VGAGRRIELVGANGNDLETLVRPGSEVCAQMDTFIPSQLIQHPPEQGFDAGERVRSSERL